MGLSVERGARRRSRTRWPRSSAATLSDDQKAMLRLLAQREEGYEDIAALTGLSGGEVRTRVRDSLAELDGERPRTPSRRAQRSAREPEPAAAGAQAPRRSPPANASAMLLENRRLLAQIGGCVADRRPAGPVRDRRRSTSAAAATTAPAARKRRRRRPARPRTSKVPTQAVLKAVDGSDAKGAAIFGRAQERRSCSSSPPKGWHRSPQGSSYTVSLARSPTNGSADRRDQGRRRRGRSAPSSRSRPTAARLLASGFDQIDVSLVRQRRTARSR